MGNNSVDEKVNLRRQCQRYELRTIEIVNTAATHEKPYL